MVHACPQTREGKSRIHVEETEELSHKMNLFPAFKQLVMKKYENHATHDMAFKLVFPSPNGTSHKVWS